MNEQVEVGSAGATIAFACTNRLPNGFAELLTVTVRGSGLHASHAVYEGYDEGFEGLARFFEEMANSWRGWREPRTYESIEGDLQISAAHDGHVRMRIVLREATNPDGWLVESTVVLDPGEELTAAARDIADLVRP